MFQYSLRLAARLVVLVPGIIIAYVSVRDIFPYFDHRLPDAVAIVLTYALGAYVLVPALIRFWRIIWPPDHLPTYCITPDGFASDPVNVGIIATRNQLIKAMRASGWYVADPHRGRTVIRQILSVVYGWSYPNAPVSNLYLFGRKQDIAFEIPFKGKSSGRHHVRFWATTYEGERPLSFRSIHWHHRKAHVQGDNLLWVGAASMDVGIGYIRHNLQLTHTIDPDTNRERDFIVRRLRAKGLAKSVETVELGQPYRLINRVITGYLHADGKMAIIRLR